MAKIQSSYIGRLMVEAGLITEAQFNNCTRIVLDAPANGLPQLYIVLAADEEFMAKLAPIMEPLLEQTEIGGTGDAGFGEAGIRDSVQQGGRDSGDSREGGHRTAG